MPLTNYPNGITSFGVPIIGGFIPTIFGRADYWFVDADTNSPGDGKSPDLPFATIQAAVDAYEDDANPRRQGVILISPREEGGGYDEAVTIANAAASAGRGAALYLIGTGPRGSVAIAPSTVGLEAVQVSQNNVTFINVGIEAEDTADFALRVWGARFRAYGCKFEGPTADVVRVGPQTIAGGAASGVLTGADAYFYDCEFAWGGSGIVVVSTNFGACTQLRVEKSLFHNLTVAGVGESDGGVIGAGRDVWLFDNYFGNQEDNTAPTDYLDMNSAGYTGFVSGNYFATPTNAAAVLQIAAGVKWGPNGTEAGWSTARPV